MNSEWIVIIFGNVKIYDLRCYIVLGTFHVDAASLLQFSNTLMKSTFDGMVDHPGCTALNTLVSSIDMSAPYFINYFPVEVETVEAVMNHPIPSAARLAMNQRLNAIINWAKSVYNSNTRNKSCARASYDLLHPVELELRSFITCYFEYKSCPKALLGMFTVFFNIRLVFLQELAFVDPYAADPLNSNFVQLLKNSAVRSAEYVKHNYNLMINERVMAITPISHTVSIHDTLLPSYRNKVYTVEFRDEHTGKIFSYQQFYRYKRTSRKLFATSTRDFPNTLMEKVAVERRNHLKQVKDTLTYAVLDAAACSHKWRSLAQQPLPKSGVSAAPSYELGSILGQL